MNVIDSFTIPVDTAGNHVCADFTDTHSVDCAYVIAGFGHATYLTINVTYGGDPQGDGNNRWYPSMTEAKSSTGRQSWDAVGAAKSSLATSQYGVSLTPTGNDFIFQVIDAGPCSPGSGCSITPNPTCSGQTYSVLYDDHYAEAYALNTSCGAAPTWNWDGSLSTGVVGAIAFKE
jgi:hypothetical protein